MFIRLFFMGQLDKVMYKTVVKHLNKLAVFMSVLVLHKKTEIDDSLVGVTIHFQQLFILL